MADENREKVRGDDQAIEVLNRRLSRFPGILGRDVGHPAVPDVCHTFSIGIGLRNVTGKSIGDDL